MFFFPPVKLLKPSLARAWSPALMVKNRECPIQYSKSSMHGVGVNMFVLTRRID